MRLPLLPALLWLCLLHPCTAAPAGPGRYYVRQFTDENGLPQNSVTGLALDELGFVWVATQGGLARFDGQHTFVYDKEKLGTRSSRMIRLTSLAGKSTLYSVDEYFRLIRIKNGKAYRVDKDVKNGVALPALLPLLQDTLSRMKVDTTYTSENYPKYEFIPMGPDRYAVYTDEKIAFLDASGIIGITAFPGTPYFNEFPSEPEHRTRVITDQKQKVCVENFMNVDNVLFYHLHGEGVNFKLISEHEVRSVTLRGDIEKHPAFLKKKSHIRSFRNRIHGQAFAYLEGSLYLIRYSPDTGHLITRLLLDNFDLETSMVVKMLYQESSQTLFLGSIAKGIFVVRQKVFDVVKDQYNSDFHNIFYAHLPFTDSSVLTPEGLVLDRQHRVPVQIRGLASLRPPAERFSMLKDRAGNFWIAKGKQFYCLDAKGNFLQSVTDRDGGFGERKLCRGLGNDIWVGSKTGQIGYIDLAAKDETKNARAIVRINGKIGCLLQTQRGELWIGTSQGLMRYDSLQRRTELIKGLEQMDIRSLYSSNPREIWITTYGDGFFLLSNGRLTRLPADREGFLNQAHCIVEDKFHDFWIPSNKGLFRAHKQDLIDYAAGKECI
ncbi:hypothetical protein GCM10023091_28760 [Ravibacter arvi]|uniref:Hybrid sensor histidine kinase/response regulator n=1 Tax=Ravibacter arvi TaxID=2051041 RepID=A0ABP8M0Y0_9BACT